MGEGVGGYLPGCLVDAFGMHHFSGALIILINWAQM
jgi:hypothetical protein